MLELKGVKVRYGSLEVLHGIDLDVGDGEIICLLGNNAAGKSTLVNSILGIVRLSEGEIWFRGERIDQLSSGEIIARGFAVVPEDGQVFTDLTVLENLRMGLYLKPSSFDTAAALEKVCALYPILKERLRQKAGLMSGGERQMLAMARALISDPSILILDSPPIKVLSDFFAMYFPFKSDRPDGPARFGAAASHRLAARSLRSAGRNPGERAPAPCWHSAPPRTRSCPAAHSGRAAV